MHAAHQLLHLNEGSFWSQRSKCAGLVAEEPIYRSLTGGAVDSHVSHLAHPPRQVSLKGFPAVECMPGDGVSLHVAHPVLVLTLRSSSEGCTGPRPEAPVGSEGAKDSGELHLVGLLIVVFDQLAGVVDKHFLGEALEVPPRGFHAQQPIIPTLMSKRLDERAP